MTIAEAAYLNVMRSHDWHVTFMISQETGMSWWEARTPEDPEIRVIAVGVEDLFMAWLSQPMVIMKLFGIDEQRIATPKENEQPKGGIYDALSIRSSEAILPHENSKEEGDHTSHGS